MSIWISGKMTLEASLSMTSAASWLKTSVASELMTLMTFFLIDDIFNLYTDEIVYPLLEDDGIYTFVKSTCEFFIGDGNCDDVCYVTDSGHQINEHLPGEGVTSTRHLID